MAYLDATQNRSLRTSLAMCSSDHIRGRFGCVPHLRDASAGHHDIVRFAHMAMSGQQPRIEMDSGLRNTGSRRLDCLDHTLYSADTTLPRYNDRGGQPRQCHHYHDLPLFEEGVSVQ